MIIGPNPQLDPLDADLVGRSLRRVLRHVAGDRIDEVRTIGGGRVSVPADLFVTLAGADLDAPELDSDDALVIISITAAEELILTSAWQPTSGEPAMLEHVDEPTSGENDEPTSGEPATPAAAKVDPTDKDQFPNIDSLVEFAKANHIDIVGLTKRGDLETAITAANTTTTEGA